MIARNPLRYVVRTICLLLVAAGTALTATSCGARRVSTDADASPLVRVMVYNIRVGAGPVAPLRGDALKENMWKLSDMMRRERADIILLQEVDRGVRRSAMMDQARYLADELGYHHLFSPAIELDGGDYGIALLSRWPISANETVPLFKPDYETSRPDYPAYYSEQRVAQAALIEHPRGPLVAINTHLGLTRNQRRQQLQQLAELADKWRDRGLVILGGDLNCEPGTPELAPIDERFTEVFDVAIERPGFPGDLATFPATRPDRKIDYLYTEVPPARIPLARVLLDQLSDHRAILAEIDLSRRE